MDGGLGELIINIATGTKDDLIGDSNALNLLKNGLKAEADFF